MNKGVREYKKSHPRQTLHSIENIDKGSREYKSPMPVKLHIQLRRSTKVVMMVMMMIIMMIMFDDDDDDDHDDHV